MKQMLPEIKWIQVDFEIANTYKVDAEFWEPYKKWPFEKKIHQYTSCHVSRVLSY